MRSFPTLSFALLLSAFVTTTATSSRAQSDGGPEDCALEEGWQPGSPAASSTVIAGWEAEAAAHGDVGSVSSFDLTGSDIHLNGNGLVVEAGQGFSAIALHDGQAGRDYLFVSDATVGSDTGTLVVQGPRIVVSGGTVSEPLPVSAVLARGEPSVVSAAPSLVRVESLALDLSEDWASAESLAQQPDATSLSLSGTTLSGTVLSGYERAILVNASGETVLTGPIVIGSAGQVSTATPSSDTEHAMLLEATSAFSAAGDQLALAGNFTSGTLTVSDAALARVPKAVLLRGGPVVVTANGASAEDVRVTQALDDEGPLLQASIEAVSSLRYLRVPEDGFKYLPAAVREAGFQHDALFGGIEVDGCVGVETVQVVVEENFPSVVGVMMDVLAASSWAAPIVAITVIVLLPGAILFDAFVSFLDDLFCIFGCPAPPPPPKPYPAWLEPGEARPFELVVNGDLPPGDYPTRIRLLGKNHESAELNVLVRVGTGSVPEEWHCPIDLYGSYGSCDCGCGVVDPDCPADGGADACELVWCSGSPTSPGGMVQPDDVTSCLHPPAEWSCDADLFAQGDDVCDCGCGAPDPDCGEGATADDCASVWCEDGFQGGRLVEGSLAQCLEPPAGWGCSSDSYGDDICDCGCGALDLDCPTDAGVEACQSDLCPGEVDPNDLASCLEVEAPEDPIGGDDDGDEDDDDERAGFDCASSRVTSSGVPLALFALPLLAAVLAGRRRRAA